MFTGCNLLSAELCSPFLRGLVTLAFAGAGARATSAA